MRIDGGSTHFTDSFKKFGFLRRLQHLLVPQADVVDLKNRLFKNLGMIFSRPTLIVLLSFHQIALATRKWQLTNTEGRKDVWANSARRALIPVAFSLIILASIAEAQIRTIVQTGDPAPNSGTTFRDFGLPSLNNAGQLVFFASLFTGDMGIYRSVIPGPGATLVASRLGPAPGGGVFIEFSDASHPTPAMTSSGEIVFPAILKTTEERSVFSFSSTGVGTRFTTAGVTAPDGNGVLNGLPGLSLSASNNNHQVAFTDALIGTNNAGADNLGIFRAGNGGLTQIVREGAIVPNGNGRFGESLAIGFGPPILNDAGTVAFRAGVIGSNTQIPGYTSSFDSGIFAGNGGQIVQIARGGQTGIPGGGTFMFFSDPANNNNNQIAFSAEYQLDTISYTAIYRNDSGTLKRIAYSGEALPGGGIIDGAGGTVVINDAGEVASQIGTFTNGTSGSAIMRGSGGPLAIIARSGQPTPRGGAGVTFYSFGGRVFAMNALGDVAFTARLSNGSIGLFLNGDQIGLLQIAEVGDVLNGSTITGLDLAGAKDASNEVGNSPLQMGFNDKDQVVFNFQLANGKQGIAVWSRPQTGLVNLPTVAVQWNIAGAGDFNRDGKADLVWENTSTGQRAIWLLNNGVRSNVFNLPTTPVEWRIAGAGDFNGDGNTDLVWQNNSTGTRAIWLLVNGALVRAISLPPVALTWRIAGAGDFNRDGFADLVWENTSTGQHAIWLLKNGALASVIPLPTTPLVWHIAGAGDFNHDGNVDLVWENTSTGARAIWLLINGALSTVITLPTTPVAWHIAGVGDFNGNGFADLAWENTSTGARAIWLLRNGVLSGN
jgi:hypothetical protein